jgi:predicted KAP-like P-loop ATPase
MQDSDESILAWILNERPIRLPEDDIFGHRLPAQRIAALLSQATPSSVGIIGPLGCGKSSLINLIVHYLSHPAEMSLDQQIPQSADIITCKVDGWGRASGTVAEKILSLAIEEVKKHVDCVSIVNLPENYRRAIGKANSPVGAVVAALLHPSHEPIAQLAELDNILTAAGLRLVIFLEDLDRNVGDEIIRDEMPALLDRLRMLNRVSFVLAIGSDRQFSDVLIRICDYIEAVA